MTREEAIRHLEEWREIISSGKRKQVIDMAIEALSFETESCDTCKYYETSHEEYPCSDCTFGNSRYVSAEAEQTIRHIENNTKESDLVYRPSAEAVPIHEDGTLEVKVPNAQKVGRVLVMDTDSHIGGGLFYPDDAVQGEWGHMIADGTDGSHWYEYECSHCGEVVLRPYNFCPNCGAKMFREDGEE